MRKVYVGLVAVLALVGGACSKSSDDASPTATGSSVAGCTDATATDLSADDPFTVVVVNFEFQPSCFKATATSSITVENQGTVTHTFTIDGTQVDASIDAGQTFNGESPGLAPGSYPFHCSIHTQMTGTVIVI